MQQYWALIYDQVKKEKAEKEKEAARQAAKPNAKKKREKAGLQFATEYSEVAR